MLEYYLAEHIKGPKHFMSVFFFGGGAVPFHTPELWFWEAKSRM